MDELSDLPDYTVVDEAVVPHRFKVAGDVYEAAPVITPVARKLWQRRIVPMFADDGAMIDPAQEDALADAFGEFLDLLLLPESAAALAKRMADPMRPISDVQIIQIALGLISHYGGAEYPTVPSSPSSDGRPTSDADSTDTPLTTASIPTHSPTIGI